MPNRPQPEEPIFESEQVKQMFNTIGTKIDYAGDKASSYASSAADATEDFLTINEDAENPGERLEPTEVLSGVSSGFGALSSIMEGNAKADAKEQQLTQKRKDLEVQAEADRVQARQKQQKINEQLDDTLAQQKAIQGARNVATQSGSAKRSREETLESAQEAKRRVASNMRLNRIERQSRIDQLKINEDYVPDMLEDQGIANALSGLGQWGMSMGMKKSAQSRQYKNMGGKNAS